PSGGDARCRSGPGRRCPDGRGLWLGGRALHWRVGGGGGGGKERRRGGGQDEGPGGGAGERVFGRWGRRGGAGGDKRPDATRFLLISISVWPKARSWWWMAAD